MEELVCVNLEEQISKKRGSNRDRERQGNRRPPNDRRPRERERLAIGKFLFFVF